MNVSLMVTCLGDALFPDVGVAIVRNDSVLYTKGFGVLAANNKTPVNDQTLFEIGSSSKAFTATVVAMMVSDGKMRYDDKLTDYSLESIERRHSLEDTWLSRFAAIADNGLSLDQQIDRDLIVPFAVDIGAILNADRNLHVRGARSVHNRF